jgi:hypothetical protein
MRHWKALHTKQVAPWKPWAAEDWSLVRDVYRETVGWVIERNQDRENGEGGGERTIE